ncbi:MAG: hypothetical protein MJ204_11030, partial [Bacteroidales bacterium]|nr:hypothetical protein [Bacteroidales bacterium]
SFIFSLLIIMSASFIACSSKKTLHRPRQLCDDILVFLQEEGYDTDRYGKDSLIIAFNKRGDRYFVGVDDEDTKPFYVTIGKRYAFDNTITPQKVKDAMCEIEDIKTVKIKINDDEDFYFGIEFFLTDMEHFKTTFDKHIEVLDASIEILKMMLE